MAEQNNQINERQRIKKQFEGIGNSLLATSFFHPISFTRTLMQLGHEPFPLEKGKSYIFFGKTAYFLPNFYRYLNNFYLSHGFETIYTGVGAHVLDSFLHLSGGIVVSEILDRHYPEVGGNISDLKNLNQLDNYQHFRIKLRTGIRKSIQFVLCAIISRPFAVIAIRQIAQLIGNETKYLPINPLQPLMLIGSEEGPPGLFSGLMPVIVGGLISVWGTTIFTFVVDLAYKKFEREFQDFDDQEREVMAHSRKSFDYIVPFLVNSVRYPFEVCSTVMAVAGSGLFVSLLPYSPSFKHWSDAYDYLSPHELRRGGKFFLREEKGSIRVGQNNRLYASKKHFI
ncbi:hypothetical protein ACQ4LE_003802 [Meloidogyne hapla]|uniref:Acyltransferase n=1 Tax=Meloidogyne hapla TaxID=6305 RepID=A0A1I8BX56_MELHA